MKREIESGAQRDKVSNLDPGASPLGTDDEAAGRPADAERIALSRRTAPGGAEKPVENLQGAPRAAPDETPSPRVETSRRFQLAVFGGATLIIAVMVAVRLFL